MGREGQQRANSRARIAGPRARKPLCALRAFVVHFASPIKPPITVPPRRRSINPPSPAFPCGRGSSRGRRAACFPTLSEGKAIRSEGEMNLSEGKQPLPKGKTNLSEGRRKRSAGRSNRSEGKRNR